jgi:hypothetical protein
MSRTVRIVVALLFAASYFSAVFAQGWNDLLTPLNQHDPNRRVVFTLLIEESGAVADIAWQESMEARFAILQDFQKAQSFAVHGAFLRLKAKEAISFYPKEVVANGKGRNGDETCSWSLAIRDSEETSGCGGSSTRHNPLADIPYATLYRTGDGAILKVQLITTERCCIWTSADSLGRSEADQRLFEFKLTNEELRNWRSVRKINAGVVEGCEGCDNEYTANLTITLVGASLDEADDPKAKLALNACLDLPVGGAGRAAAAGEPTGGRYEFRSDPPSLLAIEATGGNANVSCREPGRGALHVIYRAPGEETPARSSASASCVELRSVNGGAPIPPIALFDENGRQQPAIESVAVEIVPAGGADLLAYLPAVPAVAAAIGAGSAIHVQGVHEGTTPIQARSRCGGDVGPAFEVEVVRCHPEVVARLAEERRIIEETLMEMHRDLSRLYASKDFERATNELASSTADLLTKTLVMIASAGKGATPVAQTTSNVIGLSDNLRDMLSATLSGDGDGAKLDREISSALGLLVGGGSGTMIKSPARAAGAQAIANFAGLVTSAKAFGDTLGAAIMVSEVSEHATRLIEEWMRKHEDVTRRERNCRGAAAGGADAQGVSLPPRAPSVKGGFPVAGDSCGCSHRQLGAGADGFGEITSGLRKIDSCVTAFRTDSLENFGRTMAQWSSLLDELETAALAGRDAWKAAAPAAHEKLETLTGEMKEFSREAADFHARVESCSGAAEGLSQLPAALAETGKP